MVQAMEPPSSSALGSEDADWLTRYPQLKPLYVPNVLPTGKVLEEWRWGPLEELEIDKHRTAAGKCFDHGLFVVPSQVQVDALVRECVLLSELRHPNIVQFLGVCSLPDSPFPVVMTEVLSMSLSGFFQSDSVRAQYPQDIKWFFLTDVAHGLLYLHTRSPPIVHRYLDPVTIMLNHNMVAKITSFRYARKMGVLGKIESERELEALANADWQDAYVYVPPVGLFPPEFLEGGISDVRSWRYCSPKFDVFSYAAVALFVLTYDQCTRIIHSEVDWHPRHLAILQAQIGKDHPVVQLIIKSLSDDPDHRPETKELVCQLELIVKNLPPSKDQHYLTAMRNRRDAQEIFTEAMQKGYVLCRLMVILLVGAAGAGKSHVKHLLLGLLPPEIRQSTPLAEPPVRAISVARAIVSSTGKVWRVVLTGELDEMLASSIKEHHQRGDTAVPFLQLASEKETVRPPRSPSSDKESSSTVLGGSPPSDVSTEGYGIDLANQLGLSDIESELLDLISKSSGSGKLFDADWVYIVDTGGQPQYQELLPAFLRDAFSFVYVTKLNEPLCHRPTVDYFDDKGRKCGSSYASPLTNQQILMQYLQLVESRVSNSRAQREGPSVFVVGTHKDLESKSETRAEKNETLVSILRPRFGARLGYYKVAEREEIIFPVNARQPGPDDQEVALLLRNAISEMSHNEPVKIPLPWYALERFLRKLAAKKGIVVLSLQECQEVAGWLGMSPNACHAALVFLARLNIIFYDPDHLPGVVFVSSQVILNVLSALVYLVHVLRGEKRDESVELQLSRHVNWLDLRDYGILTLELLSSKIFEGHYRDGVFTPRDLICLLKGRQIIAQISEKEYVMPCLLPEVVLPYSERQRQLDLSVPAFPLLIHYPDGWLPAGVYTLLIAYLQNEAKWKLTVLKNGRPLCFQRRRVEFSLPTGQPGTVTLVDSLEYLEIHIECSFPDVLQTACPEIAHSVFQGLEKATEILKYGKLEPTKAFFCLQRGPNCEDTLHPANVIGRMWTCSVNPKVGGKLEQRHLVWLDGSGVPSGIPGLPGSASLPRLGDRPGMKQLLCIHSKGERVKIIETIASQWDQVGVALEIEWNVIECIRMDAHFQQVPACCKMLNRWLEGDGYQPATWGRLIESLVDAGFASLAEKLQEILRN